MGRLGPLHEASQALGLLSSGSGPKGHGTHNDPLFLRLEEQNLENFGYKTERLPMMGRYASPIAQTPFFLFSTLLLT